MLFSFATAERFPATVCMCTVAQRIPLKTCGWREVRHPSAANRTAYYVLIMEKNSKNSIAS